MWTDEETQLARDGGNRAVAAQHANYYLAARLKKRNLALGIPVAIFTTVAGTSLFASMPSTASESAAKSFPGWPHLPSLHRALGATCAGRRLVRLDPQKDRRTARPPGGQAR